MCTITLTRKELSLIKLAMSSRISEQKHHLNQSKMFSLSYIEKVLPYIEKEVKEMDVLLSKINSITFES